MAILANPIEIISQGISFISSGSAWARFIKTGKCRQPGTQAGIKGSRFTACGPITMVRFECDLIHSYQNNTILIVRPAKMAHLKAEAFLRPKNRGRKKKPKTQSLAPLKFA
ncbi:hypothetical protein [Iodidimonas nitroreducens]|uniref:hypothetical protein n=1 Tax=Iodidimonas nitroreducens TaxID=1236968 RepID=UPI0028D4BFFF|nr:hypothetical protein [Iodidimonas nitroreducens]